MTQMTSRTREPERHFVVTGLFGDDRDFGVYKAPRLRNVDCLFFSNSDVIGQYAQAQGWKFIKSFHPVLADDRIETSLQSKWVKYLQFLNGSQLIEDVLDEPKSVLYFDHKFNVTSEHVAKILARSNGKSLLIRKTPVSKESIQVEIEAALPYERYARNMGPTRAFVNKSVARGAKTDVTICNTGLIHYRDLAVSKDLADRVYDTCLSLKQPECQIVWAVHAQAFADKIDVIEWNDPLVADIEWQDPKAYRASYVPPPKPKERPATGYGIVVAGFHRSGTSSVAGMLHESGISAGSDLMSETEDNQKGYFESWALVNLHDRLMTSKGVDWATSLDQKAPLSKENLTELRAYFDQRSKQSKGAWCMKDPRIGRYVFEWKRAAPELKMLVLYRLPNASAQSLQKRSLREFAQTRGTLELPRRFFADPDFALRLWVEHNEAYVALCEAYPDDCLVVGHAAIMNGFDVLRAASAQFGIDMPAKSAADFLDSSLLSRPRPVYVVSSDLRARAIAVWNKLCAMDVARQDPRYAPQRIDDQLISDKEGKLARGDMLDVFSKAALKELEARHVAEKDAFWRMNRLKSELQEAQNQAKNLKNEVAKLNTLKTTNTLLRFSVNSAKRLGNRLRLHNDCVELRKSGLFDESWYLAKYADVKDAKTDAVKHYLQFGVCEGRDPSPKFSTTTYLMSHEDAVETGMNPLLHFVRHGQKEGKAQ